MFAREHLRLHDELKQTYGFIEFALGEVSKRLVDELFKKRGILRAVEHVGPAVLAHHTILAAVWTTAACNSV